MKLDDLDERWVPRLAVRLRAFVDSMGLRRERLVARMHDATTAVLEPSAQSPLRALDDRFASHGPLALLRDVPQLGLLLVAAVFLTGSGVALERAGDRTRAGADRASDDPEIPTTLGPAPGTNVKSYIAATRKRALIVSTTSPDHTYTALVSFTKYLTAAQAQALLGDLPVQKVLAHVQLPNAEVLPIPVTSTVVEDVGIAFSGVSKRKVRDRKEFINLAASITGQSKEEQQFKAFYLDAAATALKEARAYGKDCACVFAALVRGKARDLAALPALPDIRAVDIGGGDVDTLQLQPLLPEQKVTVTRPLTPATGNGA
ncbi:MAG: hypothetical protein QOE05_1040 [Actinomycetota bacterium]|jgi:hypothetical protein|nr:hypothetical protein [Actinomycetota bacterium]